MPKEEGRTQLHSQLCILSSQIALVGKFSQVFMLETVLIMLVVVSYCGLLHFNLHLQPIKYVQWVLSAV